MSGDLPTVGVNVTSGSLPLLVEAIGPGPASEMYVASINLYSADTHSGNPAVDALIKNSDNSTPYSCERWLRVRFSPPFGAITRIRFWVDNYAPNPGWEVQWGLADTYKTPCLSRSQVATSPLPLADPGVDKPNVDIDALQSLNVGLGHTIFTRWIVLQAAWTGDEFGALQSSPLNLKFAWRES